jgi:hypothetical protein
VDNEQRREVGASEKKDYIEPKLEKVQKLEEVTEGEPSVATGAAPE